MSERARERSRDRRRPGHGSGAAYDKVSITLPASLLTQVRERVGERGLSAYVAQALESEERRAALDDWLAEMEDLHGPVPQDAMEEARNAWPAGPERP